MRKNSFGRVFSLYSGLVLAAITVSACSGEASLGTGAGPGASGDTALCQEIRESLLSASTKDGIEALSNPTLVAANSPLIDFLLPTDRVIGLEIDGEFLAVPHNILWWHEIANFDAYGLAVTYCPLTGSSLVFHRANVQGAEFGVSGLLFKNNLVMFDRTAPGGGSGDDLDNTMYSLWPQMLAGGFCGPSEGTELGMFPSIEMEWEDWVALHPDTRVVGSDTGFGRTYTVYPYGSYETLTNGNTLYPLDENDTRRLPKERILGMVSRSGRGIAFPFGALRDAAVGDLTVANTDLGAEGVADPVVVFWDSRMAAAVAFRPSTATQDLTFEVRDGAFVDVETGSQWSIEGKAISGPLQGDRIRAFPEAFTSFWFAFSEIYPDPVLWLP